MYNQVMIDKFRIENLEDFKERLAPVTQEPTNKTTLPTSNPSDAVPTLQDSKSAEQMAEQIWQVLKMGDFSNSEWKAWKLPKVANIINAACAERDARILELEAKLVGIKRIAAAVASEECPTDEDYYDGFEAIAVILQ